SLCASCGTVIAPNPANMCVNCIRSDVDITEGIPKQATIHFCRGCDRYLQPPNIWVKAELESRELLALCLKKLKGLAKVRLVDAGFIWTEPHSKRVKVKLTIQKEVFAATILQQVFVTEFIVAGQYCEECQRVDAQLTWKAVVQVRQKVQHKRTFLWLEQLILKHNAHKDTTNIKEYRDGLDFYYVQRGHAQKMIEFLQAVVPLKMKTSEQLISQDIHSGTKNFKFTYSVELVPICKDDLVCLSAKLARQLSNTNPLVICNRVSNSVNLLDPNTLKIADMRAQVYWDAPFTSLCEAKDLVEFYVIDSTLEGPQNGRYALGTVEVCRSTDMSRTYLVRTHLGRLLNPGDHVLGYDLTHANFNSDNWDALNSVGRLSGGIPDVVLIRKSYPNARKKGKSRGWKLKSLGKEEELELVNRSKAEKARQEMDYELFLRDIEEDSELRGMMNLYK
ncbi:NMD3 family-domain-containing protein, partial [Fimicolochytrium jonesii]|uniref:NMD3 family-domain-containing protein n=1 Tax=Fimicolochytrium jonesii TaxID=1396493 RepID=UPI0022FF0A87